MTSRSSSPAPAAFGHLAEEWAAIVELCRGFDDGDWRRPTACPGWDVKDHLAHLVGTEAMLAGLPGPPPPAPMPDHVRNPLAEANEAWVDQRRPRSGEAVLAEFEEVTASRLLTLASMTDEALAEPVPSPIGRVPYEVFLDVRVMDCWIHEQDMRAATGRPPRCEGSAAEAAVDRLTGSFGYVVGRRAGASEGASVVLSITGPVARTVAVEVRGGRAERVDAPEQPTATIAASTPVYAALAAGRGDPGAAVTSGEVAVGGDTDLAMLVLANLAQMP